MTTRSPKYSKWILFFSVSIILIPARCIGRGIVHVGGYFRKNGAYVEPHYRSGPNSSIADNWSTEGNVNPFTGKSGSLSPITPSTVKNIQQSAKLGTASAQRNLGLLYNSGHGLPQSYKKGAHWLRMAAVNNPPDREAQYILGLMLADGLGTRQDSFEAFKWFKASSDGGFAKAREHVSRIQSKTDRDLLAAVAQFESFENFERAAAGGDPILQNLLGRFFEDGINVKQDEQKALKWYRAAAEKGISSAENNLGLMYAKGLGVKQDMAAAFHWYKRSAEQGHDWGQCNLANSYLYGEGVEIDLSSAAKWYGKSAEQGLAEAQYHLGDCFYGGAGVKQDFVEAVKWYRKAAEKGHAPAQTNLGYMYEKGYGTEINISEAARWYRRSAAQGDSTGQMNLGECFQAGEGVAQSYVEAYCFFNLAAAQGEEDAKRMRSELMVKMTKEQIADGQRRSAEFRSHLE